MNLELLNFLTVSDIFISKGFRINQIFNDITIKF